MSSAIQQCVTVTLVACIWATAASAQETPAQEAPAQDASAQEAPDYLLRLGDHLLAREMQYRAIGVYEELAWSTNDDAMRKTARLRVALAYHAGGRYEDAIKAYDETLRLQLDAEMQRLVLVQLFVAQFGHYVEHNADDAIGDVRAQLAPLTQTPGPVGELARYHDARMELFQEPDRFANVRTPAACADRHDPVCEGFRRLDATSHLNRPSLRSPWVASLLSLIVPGLGSAYSGHYVDGLYYFLLTVGSAALALNVLDTGADWHSQKAAVYVLGTLAIATYVASLFGASLGAQRHNAIARYKHRRGVLERTPEVLPLLEGLR